MSVDDKEFQKMLRSVQGFDSKNSSIQKNQAPIKVAATKSETNKASGISDSPIAIKQAINKQEKKVKETALKERQKVIRKSSRNKSNRSLKTNISINRKLLHLIKFHSGECANRFIEREIIKVLLRKHPEIKSDLDSITKS